MLNLITQCQSIAQVCGPFLCTQNCIVNAIAAHKDELQKLLGDLSSHTVIPGITFLTLVDAYIMRLDTNCPDTSRRRNPPSMQIDGDLRYGTNIEAKLRALLRATRNFKAAGRVFPKISSCGPHAGAGPSPAGGGGAEL